MDSENEIIEAKDEEVIEAEAVEEAPAEAPAPTEPVLFQNVHVRNEQTYRELYRNILFGGVLNILALAIIALGALLLCATIGISIAIQNEVPLWHWCAAAFALIYIPLFKIYPYRYYVKYAVLRDAELLEGEEARLCVSVTESAILIDAPRGEHVEIKYETIKRADETKNYLLIKTHAKVIYTVSKDGFTEGAYADFCAFLRAKGIKIK
ncbi:MAG: YcxB family protein [Clostridia bacterium]|nr:YcxB family protein [Clostridia bacterium]